MASCVEYTQESCLPSNLHVPTCKKWVNSLDLSWLQCYESLDMACCPERELQSTLHRVVLKIIIHCIGQHLSTCLQGTKQLDNCFGSWKWCIAISDQIGVKWSGARLDGLSGSVCYIHDALECRTAMLSFQRIVEVTCRVLVLTWAVLGLVALLESLVEERNRMTGGITKSCCCQAERAKEQMQQRLSRQSLQTDGYSQEQTLLRKC